MSLQKRLIDSLVDYHNPYSLASRMRRKRSALLVQLLRTIHASKGNVRIVDIGGSPIYWDTIPKALFEKLNLHIDIVNLPEAIERDQRMQQSSRFTIIEGNGCDLSMINDNSYDLAHSNSTIEHVGGWKNMTQFAKEIRRISGSYYVQTPSFLFPVEPHAVLPFFHWLPEQVRIHLCMRMPLGRYPKCTNVSQAAAFVEDAKLLTKRMFSELFPDGSIVKERFMFLTKSYVAIRNQPLQLASAKGDETIDFELCGGIRCD